MSIIKNTEELNNLLDAVQKLPVKKDEQEKIVNITENGTTVVTPDEGMTLSGVTVNVGVESGGGEDTLRAMLTNTLAEYTIMDELDLSNHRLPSAYRKFIAPNLTKVGNYTFYSCGSLNHLDLGRITSLSHLIISGKHRLNALVLRNTESVVPLSGAFSNANSILNDDYIVSDIHYYCYFYVPKALIEDYKVATNWSDYANRFRAIEDYPEITGGVI